MSKEKILHNSILLVRYSAVRFSESCPPFLCRADLFLPTNWEKNHHVKDLDSPNRYIQGYCILKDVGQACKFAEESEPGHVDDILEGVWGLLPARRELLPGALNSFRYAKCPKTKSPSVPLFKGGDSGSPLWERGGRGDLMDSAANYFMLPLVITFNKRELK